MKHDLRREISAVDRELALQLSKRFHLVQRVLALKAATGEPIEDRVREAEVLTTATQEAPPEHCAAITAVFRAILAAGKQELPPPQKGP